MRLNRLAYLAIVGLFLCAPHFAAAQQAQIDCAPTVACDPVTGPANTGTGDPLWKSFGKVNANLAQLYDMFGGSSHLATAGSAVYSDILSLWSGCTGTDYPGADGACHAAGTGTVTSITITLPSWLTGTGCTITSSGTCAITAATGQTANFVLATPNGSSGALSPRALVLADLPTNLGTPSAIVLTNATGFPTLNQDTTGNAGTATALATLPTPCPGGEAAGGVDTGGNALDCFTPSTPALTTNTIYGDIGAGGTALTPAQTIGVINSGTANAQTGTTYTLALTDANNQITMNNASANTLTFPLNSSVAFPLGTLITVQQLGAGTTSIALTSGVTVQQAGKITYASLGGQYGFEQFQQVATNVWQLVSQQLGDAKFTVSNSSTCATPAATVGGNTGGTITVSPSILVTDGAAGHRWHGYLEAGVWREC